MKVLIWDTETTGLPNKKLPIEEQPYIVQFAWILIDINDNWDYEEIKRVDWLIKPPINIPYETSLIHNIYDCDVSSCDNFAGFANWISKIINTADIVAWHNISFDETIIRIEFDRLKAKWLPYDYCPKQVICTMKSSVNYCKLPKDNWVGYKYPKLQELLKKTTWEYFSWAHNAIIDCENTVKAFSILVREWVIKLKEKELLSLF
jgi:DNA polymerase III epsilon subunit-like protein